MDKIKTHFIQPYKFWTACGLDCYKYNTGAITDRIELIDCLNCKHTKYFVEAMKNAEPTDSN